MSASKTGVGGLWPVVHRELREAARHPLNRWLRVGGVLAGVVMFCAIAANAPEEVVGPWLFRGIHILLLVLICGLVPALTADCIAREGREGTLGLLFLTPLTAEGIVLGKILAQVLRALTLWLAILPLLTIPFLYGGVTWSDVANFLVLELCAAAICLAAGVVASSLTQNRAIAFILAYLLMAFFSTVSGQYQQWRISANIGPFVMTPQGITYYNIGPPGAMLGAYPMNNGRVVSPTEMMYLRLLRGIPNPGTFATAPSSPVWNNLVEDLAISAVLLLAAVRFAGWRVKQSWRDKTPSIRRQNLIKRYCTPIFIRWYTRSMRRSLERNPIAWLQQYSWKARVAKWGLCLLFLVLECGLINPTPFWAIGSLVNNLLLILAAAFTYAAVNGFLQEKKSGALELILVSPLTVNQIIFGRSWGLWKQFLPATLLLVGSDMAVAGMFDNRFYPGSPWYGMGNTVWIKVLEIAAIYLTLPVIGTCFALRAKNLFVAAVLTVAMAFGPAAVVLFPRLFGDLLSEVIVSWGNYSFSPGNLSLVNTLNLELFAIIAHVASAIFAYRLLRRSLSQRNYAF